MTEIDARKARAAIADGLPRQAGDIPILKHAYPLPSHREAMEVDTPVVRGACGAGKTFWWTALQHAGLPAARFAGPATCRKILASFQFMR